jgi:murein L,D-transpeptidase YcbB/YkuD
LFSKGYLNSKNASDEELKNALNRFQRDNGLTEEIKINTNTITALSESNKTKILRAAISLDKIRQSKIHQAKYVRINIPEYKLYFYANDSLKSMHRIIVGKNTSQTPELTSKINKIVAFPFWKVPYSICKDEALPAIKKNIAYLNNNHYKIYKDAVEINPATINWKKMTYFPYILIQQPGNFNSLGIMKFEFANNFSVYVHDTPSKSLFNRSVRNFSHGCMRCENPLKLGRIMLENDIVGNKPTKFTSDSLDTVMLSQSNRSIFLKVSIPIYVYYQTVVADRNKLVFYLDIYKRDDEYLNLLKTAS